MLIHLSDLMLIGAVRAGTSLCVVSHMGKLPKTIVLHVVLWQLYRSTTGKKKNQTHKKQNNKGFLFLQAASFCYWFSKDAAPEAYVRQQNLLKRKDTRLSGATLNVITDAVIWRRHVKANAAQQDPFYCLSHCSPAG